MLWRLLVTILWVVGARRENGKTCWQWKRVVVHIVTDVAVCAAAFFLKDTIYNAVSQALTPAPHPVYLNVTVTDRDMRYRITRSA